MNRPVVRQRRLHAGRVIEVSGAVYNGGNYASARRLIESITDAIA